MAQNVAFEMLRKQNATVFTFLKLDFLEAGFLFCGQKENRDNLKKVQTNWVKAEKFYIKL